MIASPRSFLARHPWLRPVYYPLLFILSLSLACSLPARLQKTTPAPTPAPTATMLPPTPTPQPLPPAIVESDPLPGMELPLQQPITLYFNQPMERASVEAALHVQPELQGSLNWRDDATLVFEPASPLPPESQITLNLDSGARSAQGLSLTQPVSLNFRTVGYLRLAQSLPEAEASEVDPTSAVVAAFNRPVVPLGAPADTLPPAFTLQPEAQGRGEWLNTSTYIFYPEPALEGGKTYTVVLNPDLTSVDGSPLESTQGWSFTTALPRLASVTPDPAGGDIRLDTTFTLTFNMPMDAESVAANFRLLQDGAIPVEGQWTWNQDFTALTFKPAHLLRRDTTYTLELGGQAQARGGTPLNRDYTSRLHTVPPLAVIASRPVPGATLPPYESVMLYFSAPVVDKDLLQYVTIQPTVPNLNYWWDENERLLNLYGDFAPETEYSLSLSPDLSDPWGGNLAQPFSMTFRTAALPPSLMLTNGTDVLFLTPDEASLKVQATNLPQVSVSLGSASLGDFIAMISGPNAYDLRNAYRAKDQRTWTQTLDLLSNRAQAVDLYLSPERRSLSPGLYHLRLTSRAEFYGGPYLLVVSNVHLTFKLGATEALVWAVDVRDGSAVSQAPVTIYDDQGNLLAQGQTNEQGIFLTSIPALKDPYVTRYAVIGQPGEARFALALSTWDQGLAAWEFGLPVDYTGPHLKAYLYTDRPIYRPGQTVYFRAIVRQAFNGRYAMPDLASLPLVLYKNYSEEIARFDLPLSAFATAHGEYSLPTDAPPGDYRLASPLDEFNISVTFRVADYRKPEINLNVSFTADQIRLGQTLQANLSARYFFDAPAGNLPVKWALYAAPSYFDLPGYQVGAEDTRWLDIDYFPGFYDFPGNLVAEGEASTDAQGLLTLELPTEAGENRTRYTLEVTAQDESGLPVSARTRIEANPADFYIGLRPDAWVGRAGEPSGFEVQVVDWEGHPAGVRALHAEFQKVVWVRQEPPPENPYIGPTFTPQYTPIGSTDFQTNEQGQARLSFTPPEPGTYQLDVSGEGARSQMYLWVGGAAQAIWPNLPLQRLRLVADKKAYQPGETAQVFVPNPLGPGAQALVTLERGRILRHQVVTLEPGGSTLSFPLTADEAPNVYVVVTLLGHAENGQPDFRQGYLNLPVTPSQQTLKVTVMADPPRAGPGEEVNLEIQVTDQAGQPVQGEFSLALVDKAVLALAEPNVADIEAYFYGQQPLGVRTSLALAAYVRRSVLAGGRGGGGGDGMITQVVRERFPDTAYWNAEIVTDAQGRARVTASLPDSLTTWQVLVRGVADDTRVGQGETDLVVGKELLVRPVTPRFLVVNDHLELAAVVQNNTSDALQAEVSLQASGFSLDDPASALQSISLPGGGRVRVTWWGSVQDVPEVDLVFAVSARAGDKVYQDATRPTLGALPVLHYTAPQTFSTSGILDEGGERLELVSLPRSFDPTGGNLRLEMSSSLAGVILSALDALEHSPYECTEQTLSRLLSNLETYRLLQQFGIQAPTLKARLEGSVNEGLNLLLARQNSDGGWPWWAGPQSDPYVTAYVVFGLSQAQAAGLSISQTALSRAMDYLRAGLFTPHMSSKPWQLDRLAFIHFALAQAGAGDLAGAQAVFTVRDQLSPWAQAFLALSLERLSPGNAATRTLFSDLQASALRSATGVHWEDQAPTWQNMSNPITTSAIVLYALAQKEPASPLVADAVRYLIAHRQADSAWASTYSTAWSLLALAEVMRGTGELGGEFAFSASINGLPLASGQASPEGNPVTASLPLSSLYPDAPNALTLRRDPGPGRLYYRAALNVFRPVEEVASLSRGLSLQRAYYPLGQACPPGACAPIQEASAGQRVLVRLSLTLEEAAYYLLVEDYLPAGAEVLDTSLKTSQQGLTQEEQPAPLFDPRQPFREGWGWWYFQAARIYDDHIAWAADYLPPGTYELTYILVILQPGEYRVLPARAWQFYFPEVQGNSAGQVFTIRP